MTSNVHEAYVFGRFLVLTAYGGVLTPDQVAAYLTHPFRFLAQALSTLDVHPHADLVRELIGEISSQFLSRPRTEEEEAFVWLGIQHQRLDLEHGTMMPARSMAREPALPARYEIRLDHELHQWTIAHGGASLIRALLRAARAHYTALDHGDL